MGIDITIMMQAALSIYPPIHNATILKLEQTYLRSSVLSRYGFRPTWFKFLQEALFQKGPSDIVCRIRRNKKPYWFLSNISSNSLLVLVQPLPKPTPPPNAVIAFLAAVPRPPLARTILAIAPAKIPTPE